MASSSSSSSLPNLHPSHRAEVRIVTKASELPAAFLAPSPSSKLVIGFDNEGVKLGRDGTLCVMQLAFDDAIYIVDTIEGEENLVMKACKAALESEHVTKVIHDCKRDSEALYFQFGIRLNNVVDTQIAYSLIESQEQGKKVNDYISFVDLLADPRYCGVAYPEKEEVRLILKRNTEFWRERPLTEYKLNAAAADVRYLIHIYHKMMEKLSEKSLWYLAVRGGLYCRCFCGNAENWPPLAPEALKDENGKGPEEERIWVLDIPAGGWAREVIGDGGITIRNLRKASDAEIHIVERPPDDKAFIIGTEKEAKKAMAMVRGVWEHSEIS
ncbi:hypothetical protein JHK87_009325 [Glycine soja]|nr:hypothetical protein JHK87_009325 [Glycine soja]